MSNFNIDEKDLGNVTHDEHANASAVYGNDKDQGLVADTLAADYIDPTVIITPEENKRLRRKAFR